MIKGINYKPKDTAKKFLIKGGEDYALLWIMLELFNKNLELNIQESEIQAISVTLGFIKGVWSAFWNWKKNRNK